MQPTTAQIEAIRADHGPDVAFFYEHNGYSYSPATETSEQGRLRCAHEAARAEEAGRDAGLSFDWRVDPDINSSDHSEEQPPYELWECICYDENGTVAASLHGIDFGRDGSPHSAPYRRCVEAELAAEALS